MKIACITSYDAKNRNAFGGRGYFMARALENHSTSIDYLGPLYQKLSYRLVFKAKENFYKHLIKKRYTRSRDRILIKDYSRQISSKLYGMNVDLIFSPTSPGSQPVAYLKTDKPIVIWTDTPLASVINFYPSFSNLCKETIRDGLANEKSALERCALAIFKSEWAAELAKKYYQIEPDKVKVVPGGPNIECHRTLDDIKAMVNSRSTNRCRLLFIGEDWHRKGGEVAVQVAKELNKIGLNTDLTIVGCQPNISQSLPDFVVPLGYIDKSTEKGLSTINSLFADSHFLIIPSKAEAMGVVFCEASSFGVPSLAPKIGGIPTAVRDGLNGKTFPTDASTSAYCSYILDLFSDYRGYKNLALSSFHEYRTRLNWRVSGKKVKKFMQELLS